MMLGLFGRIAASAVIVGLCLPASAATPAMRKGVNYLTGEGIDRLNCDAGDHRQVSLDLRKMKAIGVRWVRVETAMTAVSALPKPPTCPAPAGEFDNLINLLAGVDGIGARPVVNILGWHYQPAMADAYKAWLNRLLDAIPGALAFEIGNEENLSVQVESYPGADPNQYPYGWSFNPKDFAADDPIGECPPPGTRRDNLDAAIASYVAWLSDTSAIIKARQPGATVVLGGVSSYQPACWLERMGQLGAFRFADAIGYHPYPRTRVTPRNAAGTLTTLLAAMARWPRPLPVWVTEFGFSTNHLDNQGLLSEREKARDVMAEFDLLVPRVSGPILVYTARDYPLTSAQWVAQCPAGACPGNVGGFGLFEWRDGVFIEEPAGGVFGRLGHDPG